MKTALDYLSRIMEILNESRDEYIACSKQLSLLDLEAQDVLHNIENETFDVVRGYYLSKQLKDIRLKRRGVKNKQELLQILMCNVQRENLEKISRKLMKRVRQQDDFIYTPRILTKPEHFDEVH